MSTSIDPVISSVVASKNGALRYQVTMAVEAKRLDATEAAGEAIVELLQAAAQMSKSLGKGVKFDAVG